MNRYPLTTHGTGAVLIEKSSEMVGMLIFTMVISSKLMNTAILRGIWKMRVDIGTIPWDLVAGRQFTNIGIALYGRRHLL